MYVKWSKTNIHEVNVKERNENTLKKKKNLTTSLIDTPPITKHLLANSPFMYMTTLISKLLPRFITSDKG